MSGGIAYVFDEKGDFTEKRCNRASVDLEPVIEPPDVSNCARPDHAALAS